MICGLVLHFLCNDIAGIPARLNEIHFAGSKFFCVIRKSAKIGCYWRQI